jgi:hypothetical protein
MTEAEWLACDNPQRMIQCVSPPLWGERRGRLFTVACCRLLDVLFDDPLARAIETAERFADGQADDVALSEAIRITNEAVEWEARYDIASWRSHAAEVVASAVQFPAEEYVAIDELVAWAQTEHSAADEARRAGDRASRTLTALVREFVGNPFRPVTFSPDWRTATAVALAAQMYESRDFSAMPILADALQDAGCDSADVLDHCRGPGAHVRGCWVVDLMLGKK